MDSARFGAALGLPVLLLGASLNACSSHAPEGTSSPAPIRVTPKSKLTTQSTTPVRHGEPHIMPKPRGEEARQEMLREHKAKHSVFGPSSRLQYFGGPIIADVHVVVVDWTAAVDSSVQALLPGFYTAVTGPGSPYLSWMAEYSTTCAFGPTGCNASQGLLGAADGLPGTNQSLGFGSFDSAGNGPGGVYVITPGNTATTLADSQIATEISNQITAGSLPQPTLDSGGNVNTVYMIDFPQGYIETVYSGGMLATSCVDFCGYHSTMVYGPDELIVPYGVLPDESAGSDCNDCGPAKDYHDNSTSVHSHELVESITDTGVGLTGGGDDPPLGWYDPGSSTDMGGEVADLCAYPVISGTLQAEVTFPGGPSDAGVTFTVQKIWSDQNSACIAVAPVCNGSNNPPSCTPCTSSSQCSGTTPDCETNGSSSFFGQCVACSSDAACGDLTCNPATDTCQCSTSTQCANPTPVCNASHTCVGCMSDADCKGNSEGEACNDGTCVPCTKSSDCPPSAPICNTFSNTCYASDDGGSEAGGPVDSGPKDSGSHKDTGGRDASSGSGVTSSGGCASAPSSPDPSGGSWLLVLAGVVTLRRRPAQRRARKGR
jgi:MYXO-CTERM domain-containing protein